MKQKSKYMDIDDVYAEIICDLKAQNAELLEAAKWAVSCLLRLGEEMGQIGDNGDQALQALEAAIEKAEKTLP